MTLKEAISNIRDGLREPGGLRYKTGTTTGTGAATGLTVVSSSLGGVDDSWNQAEILITSGNASGQRREISDFATAGTITVDEAFTHQIVSGVTFEIGEKQFVSDHQILLWMTNAQDILTSLLTPDAFPTKSTIVEVTATAGVSAVLATAAPTMGLPPKTLQFRDSNNLEYDMIVLPAGEKDKFRNHGWLGSSKEDAIAIFEDGKIKYRPTNNGTILLPIVPRLDSVTFSGGSQLPSYMHPAQNYWAMASGWEYKEDVVKAAAFKEKFLMITDAINKNAGYSIKQGEE